MSNDATNAGAGTPAEPAGQQPQPQAGTTAAVGTQAEPTGTPSKTPAAKTGSEETLSLEEAKKLRAEAQSLRKRLQEYEDAKLTESERTEKRAAEAQRAAIEAERTTQERITRWAVQASASRLGIHPDLAALAIDRAALQFDANGDPTNVDELIGAAIAKYGLPTGQAPAPTGGNVGAPARSATGATLITQQQFGDYGFHTKWEKEHNGQTLGTAVMKGEVRVTG